MTISTSTVISTIDSLIPDWPAPASVKAVISTRQGGCSGAPYHGANLGLHVGDNEAAVLANRQQWQQQLGLPSANAIQWLEQVHGVKVVQAVGDGLVRTADATYTDQPQLACTVLTADCLPVLLCNQQGTQVAAIHAGWRSLAHGIIRNTVSTFSEPSQLLAYLAPAIGPSAFEVGFDVLEAFYGHSQTPAQLDEMGQAFRPSAKPLKFYADLYQLARAELNACGVTAIYGGGECTYTNAERFFSYRHDGVTGRFASAIWLT